MGKVKAQIHQMKTLKTKEGIEGAKLSKDEEVTGQGRKEKDD